MNMTDVHSNGKQVCDQWDLVQFSDSGVSPFNGVQFHCF